MAGTVQPPSFETGSVVAQTIYIRSFDSIKVTDPESDDPDLQVQLDSKEDKINLTTHRAVVTNDAGGVAASNVTDLELSYVSGVTSSIQTQLNSKQQNITGAASTVTTSNLDASRAVVSGANGKLAASAITTTELDCLGNVSSNIQDQLDALQIPNTVIESDTNFSEVANFPFQTYSSGMLENVWSSVGGTGANNPVNSFDAIGTTLYAGGIFTQIGGVSVNRIAKLDTTTGVWSSVGSGGPNNNVAAICHNDTHIFVGGSFTAPGSRIAKYDIGANSWSGLAGGITGIGVTTPVQALCMVGTDLYVGGDFTQVDGTVSAMNIAKYDTVGGTWSAVGTGTNDRVLALHAIGTDLYIGGAFTQANGVSRNRIVKYATDTDTWSGLGSGTNGIVLTLASIGAQLYVAGGFTNAGGISVLGPARYNTSTNQWANTGVPGQMNATINDLSVTGTDLLIVGSFTQAMGITVNYILRFDTLTNTTYALRDGTNGDVFNVCAIGSLVYASGLFTSASGVSGTNRIATCNLAATPASLKTADGSSILYTFTESNKTILLMPKPATFLSTNNVLSLFISPSTSPAINPKECVGTATSDTTPVTVDISHASYANSPVVTLTTLDVAGTTLLCPQLTEVTSTSFKFIVLDATSTAVTGITCHWRAVGV